VNLTPPVPFRRTFDNLKEFRSLLHAAMGIDTWRLFLAHFAWTWRQNIPPLFKIKKKTTKLRTDHQFDVFFTFIGDFVVSKSPKLIQIQREAGNFPHDSSQQVIDFPRCWRRGLGD